MRRRALEAQRIYGHDGGVGFSLQSIEQIGREREGTMIRKAELAKELNVSPRTIDNWVRQKRIPVHRFSSRLLRYDLRKVQSALDKYEVIEAGRKFS
jgi:hypothetical protein